MAGKQLQLALDKSAVSTWSTKISFDSLLSAPTLAIFLLEITAQQRLEPQSSRRACKLYTGI